MTQVEKLLQVARAEIGVAEDPPGSNNVKYNTDYYGREVSGDKYPWCMSWVWDVFRLAGLSHLFYGGGKTASCTVLMRWAKSTGQFVTADYQAGDVFFYDNDSVLSDSEHTGIYTGERSGERYKAIEGNYANAVCMVFRKPDCIIGAFRPKWAALNEETPVSESDTTAAPAEAPTSLNLPNVNYGDQSDVVRAMQILLIGRGFHCGSCAADGEFGPDTRAALKRFQARRGLTVDGICGVKTWKSLLGVKG